MEMAKKDPQKTLTPEWLEQLLKFLMGRKALDRAANWPTPPVAAPAQNAEPLQRIIAEKLQQQRMKNSEVIAPQQLPNFGQTVPNVPPKPMR